ncbi:MAG: hypothetical protein KDC44_14915 [Phaeodactylibacter sp.]|nr:hypothetical protein [Phaeodactylibacter sp.]
MLRNSFFLLGLLFLAACGTSPTTEQDTLGELHFKFQGNQAAQPHFERGLLLLHNFEYDDARAAFLEAQQADPDMVMAYWGEAMSYNHPLWRQQDYEAGRAALAKLGDTPEARQSKAANELEGQFLQAVELLYGEGAKNDRDQAYSEYLEQLFEAHPEHEEVAAFYALSIPGAVPDGRDMQAYERGAAVASAVLTSNPNHPGALHYLIHSYDDPVHAHLALEAAASYSNVAKDAVHALHMPSHIFLALGKWEDVIRSNIASWEASVARKQAQALDNDALSYHALHWLQYGYMQTGNREAARQIMDDMLVYADTLPSKTARGYLVSMRGAYLVETGDRLHPALEKAIDLSELGITGKAKKWFTDGMVAYLSENRDSLDRLISKLEEARTSSALLVNDSGLPMCSSGSASSYKLTQMDIDYAWVMEQELRAMRAMLDQDDAAVEAYLQAATEKESELRFGFGPPVILKPSHELYGEWLLQKGRTTAAKVQLEAVLERAPNRRIAVELLEGLSESI